MMGGNAKSVVNPQSDTLKRYPSLSHAHELECTRSSAGPSITDAMYANL